MFVEKVYFSLLFSVNKACICFIVFAEICNDMNLIHRAPTIVAAHIHTVNIKGLIVVYVTTLTLSSICVANITLLG